MDFPKSEHGTHHALENMTFIYDKSIHTCIDFYVSFVHKNLK